MATPRCEQCGAISGLSSLVRTSRYPEWNTTEILCEDHIIIRDGHSTSLGDTWSKFPLENDSPVEPRASQDPPVQPRLISRDHDCDKCKEHADSRTWKRSHPHPNITVNTCDLCGFRLCYGCTCQLLWGNSRRTKCINGQGPKKCPAYFDEVSIEKALDELDRDSELGPTFVTLREKLNKRFEANRRNKKS
jgi:hypothetical protein